MPTARKSAQSQKSPRVVEGPSMMQALSKAYRSQGVTVGFVPTMGALHSGHVALLREARLRADVVVCSIFVNPLQFNDANDLARYPKTFDADLRACAEAGVDVVFAPQARDMYPPGYDTGVRAGMLGASLEGKSRPGHFDGMLTVVLKLFHAVEPHFAVFGEKDYQQLQLVKRMVSDFHLPIEIVPMPVIRDTDGLALSSRNARLKGSARKDATILMRALQAAQDVVAEGEHRAKKIEKAARAMLDSVKDCHVDYVACVDPKTLAPVALVEKPARLLIAARIGSKKKGVRLIDNGPLFPDIGTARKPKRRPPTAAPERSMTTARARSKQKTARFEKPAAAKRTASGSESPTSSAKKRAPAKRKAVMQSVKQRPTASVKQSAKKSTPKPAAVKSTTASARRR